MWEGAQGSERGHSLGVRGNSRCQQGGESDERDSPRATARGWPPAAGHPFTAGTLVAVTAALGTGAGEWTPPGSVVPKSRFLTVAESTPDPGDAGQHGGPALLLVAPELLGKAFRRFPAAATRGRGLPRGNAVTGFAGSQDGQLLKPETPRARRLCSAWGDRRPGCVPPLAVQAQRPACGRAGLRVLCPLPDSDLRWEGGPIRSASVGRKEKLGDKEKTCSVGRF